MKIELKNIYTDFHTVLANVKMSEGKRVQPCLFSSTLGVQWIQIAGKSML